MAKNKVAVLGAGIVSIGSETREKLSNLMPIRHCQVSLDKNFHKSPRGLGETKIGVNHRSNELHKEGIVKNRKRKSDCPVVGWGKTVKKALWAITLFGLGVIASVLILYWTYLNSTLKEYPLVLLFIGTIFSLAGIYIALRHPKKA